MGRACGRGPEDPFEDGEKDEGDDGVNHGGESRV